MSVNNWRQKKIGFTGKSLSETLFFEAHGENMLCAKNVLNVKNNFGTQHVLCKFEFGIFMYWACNSMNNLSSYCGLVDAKTRVSDKDLPVMSQEKNKVKIVLKRCLVSLKACSLCLKSSECDRTVGGQVSRRRFNSLSRLLNAASNPNLSKDIFPWKNIWRQGGLA